MTNAELARKVKQRWDANGVKPGTTKARLIEFEFLQGVNAVQPVSPYVSICMMSGRTIVTAELLKEAEVASEDGK